MVYTQALTYFQPFNLVFKRLDTTISYIDIATNFDQINYSKQFIPIGEHLLPPSAPIFS